MSSVDVRARMNAIGILKEKFKIILDQIQRGEKPTLVMPKRVLSNTIYDEKNKMLLLGPDVLRRSLIDVNEARKFMQTLLMASIIYE
ncbi:MAG: DNA topoisomerase IV subunit A, partial [Thermogladius sp.]